MIRLMARIGMFTLFFVSLSIIARAEIMPDMAESIDTRISRFQYPLSENNLQLYFNQREEFLKKGRDIEKNRLFLKQTDRIRTENYDFERIVEFLDVLIPGVTAEQEFLRYFGEPEEVIDGDSITPFSVLGAKNSSSYYVYLYGYPQPRKGQRMLAKRFHFTAMGDRQICQILDVLVTVEKKSGLVDDYGFYFRNGMRPELWEEGLLRAR